MLDKLQGIAKLELSFFPSSFSCINTKKRGYDILLESSIHIYTCILKLIQFEN